MPFGPPTLRISSPYGYRVHPITGERKLHSGVDLSLVQGTPVYPVKPGTVVRVALDSDNGGTYVIIDHGDGWQSGYFHLSRVEVHKGDQVDRSRRIGLSGGAPGVWGSGKSTGPHLHLAIKQRAAMGSYVAVDPLPLIAIPPWRVVFKHRDGVYRPSPP